MMIFGVGYQEAEGVHLRLRSYSSVFLTRRWRVKSWCWQWSGPRGQPSATKTTKSHLPFTPPSSPPAMSSPLQVPRPSPTMRFLTHPMVIKKRKTPFFPPLFFYFFFPSILSCWFFSMFVDALRFVCRRGIRWSLERAERWVRVRLRESRKGFGESACQVPRDERQIARSCFDSRIFGAFEPWDWVIDSFPFFFGWKFNCFLVLTEKLGFLRGFSLSCLNCAYSDIWNIDFFLISSFGFWKLVFFVGLNCVLFIYLGFGCFF